MIFLFKKKKIITNKGVLLATQSLYLVMNSVGTDAYVHREVQHQMGAKVRYSVVTDNTFF